MIPEAQPAYCVALVTAPSLEVARSLCSKVLESKLAACVSIIPGVESHYWWQGKLEVSAEWLLLAKTTGDAVEALKLCVLGNHPYDTPEFVVLNIQGGSQKYLEWIQSSVAPIHP